MIEGKKGGGVGVFALKRATNSKSARILELRTPLDKKNYILERHQELS